MLRFWLRRAAGRDGAASPSALLRLPAALDRTGPALRAAPALGGPQKRGLGCACVLCLPRPSGSGSQELDAQAARSLMLRQPGA